MITVTFTNGKTLDIPSMNVAEFWEAADLTYNRLFYVDLEVGSAAINLAHVIAVVG